MAAHDEARRAWAWLRVRWMSRKEMSVIGILKPVPAVPSSFEIRTILFATLASGVSDVPSSAFPAILCVV